MASVLQRNKNWELHQSIRSTVRTRGRLAGVENNKYLQLRELSKYWLDGTIWLCLSGPSLIPPLYNRNIYLLCFQILEILSEYEGAVFVAILHNMSD